MAENVTDRLFFPRRVANWIKQIKRRKGPKRILNLFFAGFFLFLGGLSYSLWEAGDLSFAKKLGIFASSILGSMAALMLMLDRLFRLELTEKQLQLMEQDVRQIKVDHLSQRIASRVYYLFGGEVPLPDSLYAERAGHYREEKLFLSRIFADLLGKRVLHLKEQTSSIRIIIDSGTTLAPIFDQIGLDSSSNESHWSQGVEFVTNNIRGVQFLLKYREFDSGTSDEPSKTRHKNVPFRCSVLPGRVLAAYQAIADEHTLKALRVLKRPRQPYYTICVTTGNYLFLDQQDRHILPIARTLHHPHVKAGLYDIADEIYNVAPLGKILLTKAGENMEGLLTRFNDDLGYSSRSYDPEKEAYQLITYDLLTEDRKDARKGQVDRDDTRKEWMRKTILVTTRRDEGTYLMHPHWTAISGLFDPFNPKSVHLDGPYLWADNFDDLPRSPKGQAEVEIPHDNLRVLKDKYFRIG